MFGALPPFNVPSFGPRDAGPMRTVTYNGLGGFGPVPTYGQLIPQAGAMPQTYLGDIGTDPLRAHFTQGRQLFAATRSFRGFGAAPSTAIDLATAEAEAAAVSALDRQLCRTREAEYHRWQEVVRVLTWQGRGSKRYDSDKYGDLPSHVTTASAGAYQDSSGREHADANRAFLNYKGKAYWGPRAIDLAQSKAVDALKAQQAACAKLLPLLKLTIAKAQAAGSTSAVTRGTAFLLTQPSPTQQAELARLQAEAAQTAMLTAGTTPSGLVETAKRWALPAAVVGGGLLIAYLVLRRRKPAKQGG